MRCSTVVCVCREPSFRTQLLFWLEFRERYRSYQEGVSGGKLRSLYESLADRNFTASARFARAGRKAAVRINSLGHTLSQQLEAHPAGQGCISRTQHTLLTQGSTVALLSEQEVKICARNARPLHTKLKCNSRTHHTLSAVLFCAFLSESCVWCAREMHFRSNFRHIFSLSPTLKDVFTSKCSSLGR